MGILTGMLLAGIVSKWMSWRNKKSAISQQDIDALKNAHKIAVIGCPGSGKTYLTFALQKKLQLPVYHLDQYAWLPGWQRIDFQELQQVHHQLCQQDSWIMEGIYFKLLSERIACADAIIFLDMPRAVCIKNILKRSISGFGKVLPGDPQGCHQNMFNYKFIDFLSYVWNFNRKHRKHVLDLLECNKDRKQIFVINSRHQLNVFITML